jgi:hypothetical protein
MKLRRVSRAMVQETIQNPEKTDSGYGDKLLAFRSYEAGVLKVVYVIENRDCVVITVIWD